MERRIVSIQHGDYREALKICESGVPEPYFGMKYSVGVLERLWDGHPHMVISLDAPAYAERQGLAELVGMPAPKLPKPIPGRVSELLLSRRILGKLREFRPTHVLLRTGRMGVTCQVLQLCKARGWNALVVFANVLLNERPRDRRLNHLATSLMNEPFVSRVGNHRWPATQSLIEAGLDPAKAIAWDTPGLPQASDHPVKDLGAPPFRLLFVGSVCEDKGVGDLIEAASILHSRGVAFHLDVVGAGEIDAFAARAAHFPDGLVNFRGRLPNSEVFSLMKEATLVIVPSRHSFPEGMPYTLTEGLASRTPLLSSDHPVMARAFKDGEGLRFFRAANPCSLADVAQSILNDPMQYRLLSESTEAAQARVACPTSFGDLLEEWKRTFPGEGPDRASVGLIPVHSDSGRG